MENLEAMINLYKKYGFNMPLRCKYKRDKNRVYFIGEFQDNEEIYFYHNCIKPSAMTKGNAVYQNKRGAKALVNISELKII